ncbi:putative 3-oxo-5-alpha-steroid 4-dehydrogenase (NADP(+)) [Helianthus annuus]|uniref:3-oxo-5-alpha-steroid 4-dehydrogenase (NADP(+)) n=2 Tax=Helianthus annuus TaxID=4232 RepID=A0A9K3IZJ6_HELAN|nr:steroid 5-alpha-reductase DET2 [Helianthus annuus]KAF5805946.1 putative 3-oxo-5-alpha-steroid 4-dehydrogenase (NADP(+)) [Helianthus annuus]KAJ0584631.1 putative 3-oxo-5-alpha-steroid 4-dehydrogenase (NADP(+)) [Helianthus annuus]KAJ0750299.1 putative 3-oxo-5-alpha-steroid 4-dehydrogenase (NADP(+)) [Helianthus annuus]KAJ0919022.1 putative 3-oxo-5-alpha-steroid 4-dehydrogenase (NADP(+)) [Helianthus annuus]KAJ0922796.1 putative 3-oxo-5-alpha-steroid 4-dehydrogenase (NADP(+)) [Helianthus annuus]
MEIAVLSKFMFDEPSVWVTVATVMTLLSTVYLGFAEIIGSHLQYSKFTNSSAKQAVAAGTKVSSRTGMLMLYTPAFVAGVVSFFVFPGGGVRFFLLKVVVTFHFFKRDFEVLFVHKYSGNMGLGSTILISIFYFYVATSLIVVHYMSLGLPEPPIDLKYVGVIMFTVGIIGNFYHHNLLAKLRTDKEKEYKIPRGGLFNLVICPHYSFEILIFYGFAFISQTPLAFACALGDSCYLIARSYQTRNWYVNKFEDFPASIKRLIPYVF